MSNSHDRRCGTCNAFNPNRQANPKAGEPRQGWCVAGPPVCMQVTVNTLKGPATGVQGVWPTTQDNAWCRSWQTIYPDQFVKGEPQ